MKNRTNVTITHITPPPLTPAQERAFAALMEKKDREYYLNETREQELARLAAAKQWRINQRKSVSYFMGSGPSADQWNGLASFLFGIPVFLVAIPVMVCFALVLARMILFSLAVLFF